MKNPIATNRFEEVGVNLQERAKTFKDAKERFDASCTKCTFRRTPHDCKACPIRATLLANCDSGWYRLKAEDYLWIDLERSSVDD